MRNRPRIILTTLFTALALFAAACGGSGVSRSDAIKLLTDDGGLPEETAVCIADAIDSTDEVSFDDLEGDDPPEEVQAIIFDMISDCMLGGGAGDDSGDTGATGPDTSEGDEVDLGGDFDFSHLSPTDPPPGEDADLDAMWVACGQGSAQACDDLYFESPFGSEYEVFGISCGARAIVMCDEILED
jgi:hypothetical protein